MSALNDYYAALERLKANKPIVLPKGSAINNDTVAMEAGRKRGSTKNNGQRHIKTPAIFTANLASLVSSQQPSVIPACRNYLML